MVSLTQYSPDCSVPVPHPISEQDWETLTFLHWRYEVSSVQRLLPPGLTVEEFDGSAWVGLVPFQMRVGFGPIRQIPYLTVFPETNVRTYVRGPDDRPGVWFFSLDIPRLVGVLLARATYHVPYMWSAMDVRVQGSSIEYRCRRRFPGPKPAAASLMVRTLDPIPAADLTQLDHFLTARWGLFSLGRRGLGYGAVEHAPWPLWQAQVLKLDETLVVAAGLPAPRGEPLVRYSPGVHARLGMLHRV